jgi:hypothetical protein
MWHVARVEEIKKASTMIVEIYERKKTFGTSSNNVRIILKSLLEEIKC